MSECDSIEMLTFFICTSAKSTLS